MNVKHLLAVPLLLASAVPSLAQVGPAANPWTVPMGGASAAPTHFACVNDTRNGYVNLRSGPSRSTSSIAQLGQGTSMSYLGETRGQDGFVWYKVAAKNRSGWVRADYACSR
jgi:uncharacterized protein YraI